MQTTKFKRLSKWSALSIFFFGVVLFCATFALYHPANFSEAEIVFAQGNNQPTFPGPGNDQGTVSGPGKGDRDTSATKLQNPLTFDSFGEFFIALIDILIIFAIPIIVLMIIYAGFLYVMARGSEEQVTKASRALTYAVLGGLLILGAELILKVIQGTVSQLTPF
jgi:hypothetical protein